MARKRKKRTRSSAASKPPTEGSRRTIVIGLLAAIAVAGLVIWQMQPDAGKVDVTVPELSRTAQFGETAFNTHCAACHGSNAAGSEQGPPLVHDIYNPGHHADGSFTLAAKRGVRQHHWRFGNMPARPEVSDGEIAAITRYVRELQAANGIVYRPHKM